MEALAKLPLYAYCSAARAGLKGIRRKGVTARLFPVAVFNNPLGDDAGKVWSEGRSGEAKAVGQITHIPSAKGLVRSCTAQLSRKLLLRDGAEGKAAHYSLVGRNALIQQSVLGP